MANTTCARCGTTVLHDSTSIPPAVSPVTTVTVYCLDCAKLIVSAHIQPKTLVVVAPPLNRT